LQGHKPDTGAVYVTALFEGSFFEKLEAGGCHVIGPALIHSNVAAGKPALDTTYVVQFSSAMEEVAVHFDAVREDQMGQQLSWLQRMGGKVEADAAAPGQTHVVAERANTAAVRAAYANNVPVLTTSWLEACWNKNYDTLGEALNFPASVSNAHEPKHVLLCRVCAAAILWLAGCVRVCARVLKRHLG